MHTPTYKPRLIRVEPGWDRLGQPYCYQWDDGDEVRQIRIKAGFCTDLASVPWFVRSLISREDLGLAPPLVHDFLYACRGNVSIYPWGRSLVRDGDTWQVSEDWDKPQADLLFLRMMQDCSIRAWRRWLGYQAVSLYGHYAWRGTRAGDVRYGQ